MTCNDTGYQAIEFDKDTHLPMVSLESVLIQFIKEIILIQLNIYLGQT